MNSEAQGGSCWIEELRISTRDARISQTVKV